MKNTPKTLTIQPHLSILVFQSLLHLRLFAKFPAQPFTQQIKTFIKSLNRDEEICELSFRADAAGIPLTNAIFACRPAVSNN